MKGIIRLWDRPVVAGRPRVSHNAILHGLGFAAAKALALGGYRLNAMYVEYENTSLAIANPTPILATSGREYYTGLGGNKDYLRVKLLGAPTLSKSAAAAAMYGDDEGNVLSCFAVTAGTTGQRGLDFSNAASSTVYGVGLVCAPDWDEPSRDIVLCRGYYDPADHTIKPAANEVLLNWELDLTQTA